MPPKRKAPAVPKGTRPRRRKKLIGQGKGFLDLPGELRNRVYEDVLISDSPIEIYPPPLAPSAQRRTERHKPLEEPALLRASRQIRKDTRKMFYLGNSFTARLENCDATDILSWQKHVSQFAAFDEQKPLNVQIIQGLKAPRGVAPWAGLIRWCEYVQKGQTGPIILDDRRRFSLAIKAALSIAESHRGGSWEKCRGALEALRVVLGSYESNWAQ